MLDQWLYSHLQKEKSVLFSHVFRAEKFSRGIAGKITAIPLEAFSR
jgi:hypothetical protein